MSIRLTIVGSLMAGFLICALGLFGIMQGLVFPVFKSFVVIDAVEDMTRATNSIERDLETLDQLTHDWASWDDLYTFMKTADRQFITSNLHRTTFANNNLSFIVILDDAQRMVWGYRYDVKKGKIVEFDLPLASKLPPNHPILLPNMAKEGVKTGLKGLVIIEKKPYLLSSWPIQPTQENERPLGVLVFARELNEEFTKRMAKLCMVNFSIEPSEKIPKMMAAAETHESGGVLYTYDMSPDDFVLVKRNFPDLDGKPSLRVTAKIPKFDPMRGSSPFLLPGVLGLLAFLVVAGLTILVLHLNVVRPLQVLARHASRINESGDYTLRLESKRYDELGHLSRNFDRLMAHIEKQTSALTAANSELERLSYLDGLTRISNRRLFDGRLESEWKRLTRRDEGSLALIMIDIDFFKSFNDRFGHIAGDDCLRQVSAAISGQVKRSTDVVARYGGEEFGVLLPATNIVGARELAERIRLAVENLHIKSARDDVSMYVTISLGVTVAKTHDQKVDQTLLIARADAALYEAKHSGRNRAAFLPFLPQAQKNGTESA